MRPEISKEEMARRKDRTQRAHDRMISEGGAIFQNKQDSKDNDNNDNESET